MKGKVLYILATSYMCMPKINIFFGWMFSFIFCLRISTVCINNFSSLCVLLFMNDEICRDLIDTSKTAMFGLLATYSGDRVSFFHEVFVYPQDLAHGFSQINKNR
jgi:hypothetical protein